MTDLCLWERWKEGEDVGGGGQEEETVMRR